MSGSKDVFDTSYLEDNSSSTRWTFVVISLILVVIVFIMTVLHRMKGPDQMDTSFSGLTAAMIWWFGIMVVLASIGIASVLAQYNLETDYAIAFFAFIVLALLMSVWTLYKSNKARNGAQKKKDLASSSWAGSVTATATVLALLVTLCGTNASDQNGQLLQSALLVPLLAASLGKSVMHSMEGSMVV